MATVIEPIAARQDSGQSFVDGIYRSAFLLIDAVRPLDGVGSHQHTCKGNYAVQGLADIGRVGERV